MKQEIIFIDEIEKELEKDFPQYLKKAEDGYAEYLAWLDELIESLVDETDKL